VKKLLLENANILKPKIIAEKINVVFLVKKEIKLEKLNVNLKELKNVVKSLLQNVLIDILKLDVKEKNVVPLVKKEKF